MLSLGLIFFILCLIVLRWASFPFFVDIYYHLSVMEMFDQAGGIVIHDFLQFAPLGRAHLYPPFLHILMLGAYKAGLSVDTIGRLVSSAMFPLTMAASWVLVRKMFGSAEALLTLVLLLCSWQFFYTTAVVSASALATVLALATFYLIYTKRALAATVTMTFCLYSHMSYPHLISLSLVVWAVFDPALRRSISRVLVASYALFSPWLIVMATNIGSMASTSAPGGNISFNVILAVCALLGIAFAIHQYRKGDCRFILPLAMLASMLPMVLYYPSRFSIHSVVPLAMLGGIGVVSLARHLSANAGRRGGTVSVLGICLLSLLVLTHGFSYDPSSAAGRSAKDGSPQTYASQRAARSIGAIHGSPTTLCMLISGETLEAPVHESPAYARIIETILGTTGPDDVIVTAQGINGCIITSYTGRATTSGMFREVGADDELALRQAIRGEWQSAIGTDGAGLAFTVIEGAYEGGHVPAAFPYPLAFILVIAGSVLALYDMRKGTGGGP